MKFCMDILQRLIFRVSFVFNVGFSVGADAMRTQRNHTVGYS